MKYLFLLSFAFIITSCKTTKTAQKNTRNMNITQLVNVVQVQPDYQYLKMKASLQADLGSTPIPNVSLTIFNEHNKKIWINGSVAILNVLRALATPEQLKAYEKIQKTYVDENYDYVNQLLGVTFIDFHSLENLLLGRVFTPLEINNLTLEETDNGLFLKTINPTVVNFKDKQYSYQQTLTFDSNMNLTKVFIKDLNEGKELSISYTNRVTYEKLNLPTVVNIFLKDTKNKEITLKYNNFDSQSMDTPYEVPNGYTKRQIK